MMKMITQSFGLKRFSQLTKQVWLCCSLFLLFTATAFGQCFNDTYLYGATEVDQTGAVAEIAPDSWSGEYSMVSGISTGETYVFAMEGRYISLYEGSFDGALLAHGPSPLEFTATSDADIYPHWTVDEACGADQTGIQTTVQCTTCVPDCEELGLNIGDACDDLNEETINDSVNELCECVGEAIPDAPENDLCENAAILECGDLVTGSNVFATNTHPKCNGSTGGNDVWYQFTPAEDMTVTLETCQEGTDFDTDLSVFTGSCDALICEPGFGGNGHIDGNSGCSFASWASTGEFEAVGGTTYYIQLTGFGSSNSGNFALSLSCQVGFECEQLEANIGDPCDDLDDLTENDVVTAECECAGTPIPQAPENDEICGAFEINCGDNLEGTTIAATNDGQDLCGTSNTAPGVWYNMAIDFTGNLSVFTCNQADFDTKISVFEADACDGELVCVDGNDDGIGCAGFSSQVDISVTEGQNLWILVHGFSAAEGNFTLSAVCVEGVDCEQLGLNIGDACDDLLDSTYDDVVTENCECAGTPYECEQLLANIGDACDDLDETTENDVVTEECECAGTPIPEAPENDEVCDAIAIECGDTVEGTTNDANPDGADFCGTSNTSPGVWYNLVVDFDGTVTASLCELTSYDTKLSVYSGASCDGELVCVAGNDDACSLQSEVEFDAINGTSYWILVHGFSSNTGDFGLSVSCIEGAECEELGLDIGDACDDGDDSTINDTVSENCECIGEPVPANEDICEAVEVACGDVVEGSTVNASVQTVESCGTGISAPGVWYNLAVDFNGSLNVSTCDNASFDTKISVYNADACDSELVCVDGNDDGAGCSGFTSDLTIEVTEGQNLWILVHGFGSNSGDFTLSLNCVETFDCEELQANIGDACDDSNPNTENDLINENCGCEGTPIVVPGDCQDWAMFINDNEGGETDIYAVEMVGGNAELSYLTTLDFHAHMAYNPADNLLYVVNNSTGYYVTVNPHVSPVEVSAPVVLSEDIPSVTTAEFSPIGKLLIGSSTQDIIYSVDINDASVSVFDSYAPISGGDIAFDEAGALYLGTRSGNGLYQVFPDDLMDDQFIGNIPNLVTGMALAEGGQQLITSHNGNADLIATNLDGSPAGSYALMLDGEAFDHNNGDLAAGCNTFQDENEGDCEAFSTYYAHFGNGTGVSGADIYSVSFSGNEAVMSFLTNVNFGAHIAYDAQSDIIYLVNPNGSFVRAYDPTAGIFLGDLPIVGDINQLFAVVFNPADGLLYVGDANDDEIYSIDLGSGVATFVADAPVSGGDLAIQDGVLYLANRGNAELYEVSGGSATLVADIPEANGMAQANNATDLVVAQPGSTEFVQFSAADGSLVASYTATIDGNPVTLQDGDMAAGCGDDEPIIVPDGECNATEVIEYVEGTTTNGGSLAANRVDASQALGAPERADELVFVTLGYDGSITLAFDGAVPNGEGDDIEVVETSYGNPGCDAYPEYADVSVSMDGINWFSAGTVCKGEPFVDISDAGDFEYVMYVRISNITELTTSGDGFDLDGVVALHNCEEEVENGNEDAAIAATSASTLTSYPNPTAGPSQVVFTTATSGTTLVEVYDMNGRSVATLFNQVTQEGQEYRVDFDGTDLPNGIYVYRLTTNGETIVDKFMVTK